MIRQDSSSAQTLRDMRRGMTEAGDAQVLQVVRMVDALDVRGASDAVLVPIRPRLRAMQPARPLRFARLLFQPVDPLIVAPGVWRPGGPYIPRHALPVLEDAIRMSLGGEDGESASRGELAGIDALIAGASTAELDTVRRAGAILWPLAAVAMRRLGAAVTSSVATRCAAVWHERGLPDSELQPLTLGLAGVLDCALTLHDTDKRGMGVSETMLIDAIAGTDALGPRASGMMMCLLMIRVPQAGAAVLAAAQACSVPRRVVDSAADVALCWLEGETAGQLSGISEGAARELNRQTDLLDMLASRSGDAAQRRRVTQARAALLGCAVHRYETGLQEGLAGPIESLPSSRAPLAATLDGLEASARALRAFELEARRLGGSTTFDALARDVEASLQQTPGLSPMDRARLMEVLAGPETAMRVLRAV